MANTAHEIDYTDSELDALLDSIGDKYEKPSTGIPKTDLSSAVQTSLGKADTALQSYTETDPVFTASAAHGITSGDITNWNSAAPASALNDYLPLSGGTMTGNITFPSTKGVLGTLTNGDIGSIIHLSGNNTLLIGHGIRTNSNYVSANIYSGTSLYFYIGNTQKFELNSSGAVFEDSITASSIIKDGGTSSQFLKADGSVDSTTYVTSSGTGASGSWNINAATASALANTNTIWGQDFDGSGNVSGNMTGVGSITASDSIYLANAKHIYAKDTNSTNRSLLALSSSNALMLGYGVASTGSTYIYGNSITVRIGGTTSASNAVVINSSGNTTLSGTLTIGDCEISYANNKLNFSNGVVAVFSGSTAPSSSTGSDGDIYIQTS